MTGAMSRLYPSHGISARMLSMVTTRTLRSFGGPGGAAAGGGFVGAAMAEAIAETEGVGATSAVGTGCVVVAAGDATGLGGSDSPPEEHAEKAAMNAALRTKRSGENRIEDADIAPPS